ncbi:Uncharacterised protein [Salmonella enterica]|uniref:Uncharacterized protein n=1 Tax=Salmonella enterica TaxID=28901 RepID=A0A379QCR2_SALER|nr:Uncharacterised protein [Salmonella enterica]
MLSSEDFYMIKQMRKQGARPLSTLQLRWVALSILSDGILNTLIHRPEKHATK